MAATVNFRIATEAVQSLSSDLGNYTGVPRIDYSTQYSSQTKVFADARTTGAGADTLVLNNGSINNDFGVALTFAAIRTLTIKNTHASNTLTIGGGSDAALGTDQITIKPGKCFSTDSAFTIDATHKNLVITPSATGTTYQILITGT